MENNNNDGTNLDNDNEV